MKHVTMKHVVALVFISLLFLIQITSVESFTIETKLHPTRWDIPSPVEIRGFLSQSDTFNDLEIEISSTLSSGEILQMILLDELCYAVLDNSKTVSVRQLEAPDTIKLEISIEKDTTLKEFYIRCEHVTISRPPSVESSTDITQTFFTINNSYSGEANIPVDMVQHPTMLHHYQWKSHHDAIIEVKFSFYRPSTMSDVSEFYLDHPLLQVRRITSTHLAPMASYVEDLQRPYHLLTRDDYAEGIECSSTAHPTLPSRIFFQRGSVADSEVTPVVSSPTTDDDFPPDEPYLCTFTIEYPADVIYASMYSMEENNLLTATIHRKGSESSYQKIPLGVPLIIPYAGGLADQELSGVFVWHSPHHLHDNMMDFEVAVATTSVVYPTTSSDMFEIIESPFNEVRFQLTYLSSSGVPQDYLTMLSEWDPTIICRPHNSIDSNKTTHTDGVINLRMGVFHGLGQVCRMTLKKKPPRYPALAVQSIDISTIFHQGADAVDRFSRISIFDTFHTFRQRMERMALHDTDSINSNLLTWNQPSIPLTIYEDGSNVDGNTYIRATMNLQYLLPYPATMDNSRFFLHLAFNKLSELQLVASPGEESISAKLIVQQGGSSYTIINTEASATSFEIPFHNVLSDTDGVVDDDPEYFTTARRGTSAFEASRRLRAPRIIVNPLESLPLDSTQPIRITLIWKPPQGFTARDIDGMVVYPFLLSEVDTLASTFSPQYARITPVRPTPLTGYSYRCVTWDLMAAPYVYGEHNPVPLTTTTPCPSYTPGMDLDPSRWNRVTYQNSNWESTCYYELAAVCVTSTAGGTYNVHPLANCPSFLGSKHAIPCHLVDDDAPTPSSLTNISANLPPTQFDENNVYTLRTMTLWWTYRGDPRGALTVSIKPVREGDADEGGGNSNPAEDESDTQGWITLARDIPAHLSPAHPEHRGVSIGFPLLNPSVKLVLIRLSLNDDSSFNPQEAEIAHAMEPNQWGTYPTGCEQNQNKMFDDGMHLCKCQDSFIPNNPTGMDNPLVHPLDFKCNEKLPEQVPIDPEKCHSIPEGVASPYFTQHCGYGFSTNKNGKCDECTCFNAWTEGTNDDKNDGKKCKRCRLMDKCVVKHTADITFNQPEYCLVERCLCKPGYSGDKCQYTVMYGTLAYHDVATDEQKASLANASKEKPVIVPRRLITTFQPRVTNNVKTSLGDTPVEAFVQQATQVLSEDGEEVITSIMVALGRLTDANVSPSPFVMATSPFTPAADDGSNNNDLGDLHYAWEQLQNNYKDRPVYKDDDYGTLNGGVGSAYDPHCVPNAYTYCPDGKEDDLLPPESQVDEDELKEVYAEPSSTDHTTTYIIIGVVVGVVLLLFIALILSILYCRKHEKMCFRKRKSKGGAASSKTASHHASSTAGLELTKTSSHSATPPSAPPSSTMSTSSYLPTQVAIADPTLPADWIALEDKSTGKVYYSNQVTMESSWDHPSQPKAKPKSAYGW